MNMNDLYDLSILPLVQWYFIELNCSQDGLIFGDGLQQCSDNGDRRESSGTEEDMGVDEQPHAISSGYRSGLRNIGVGDQDQGGTGGVEDRDQKGLQVTQVEAKLRRNGRENPEGTGSWEGHTKGSDAS